jgi:gliding motility-associated-like protein
MKSLYFFLTCFFLITNQYAHGQCPPAGFPSPTATCATAPILCANINGYCSLINTVNTPMNFPGCPGNQLNNSDWFAFYAGTTTISIQIVPSNCAPAGQQGLQVAIYSACISGPIATHCACSTAPMTLTANNFVVGQIYWIVIDGCGGDVCNYSVNVLAGSTVPVPLADPTPINGPATACAGSTTNFNVSAVPAATIYQWTITPAGLGTVTGSGTSVNVNWAAGASGTATICLDVGNGCYPTSGDPQPVCMDVQISPKPTAVISGSGIVCPGGSSTVNLSVAFTGTGPWQFTPLLNGSPQTPIQTSDNPYILQVTQNGTWTLSGLSDVLTGCTGTVSGNAVVTLSNLNGTAAVTNAQCGLSNGAINLTPTGGTTPYQFSWSGGQTTEDLSNIPAGDYTVTVTDNKGCTKTVSVTVADIQAAITISGTTVPNTTCINGNGSISVTVTPAAAYTYDWSNGSMVLNQTNLAPGTYTITVTKGLNCTKTAEFTINDQPNTPNASATTVQSTCSLPNGNINLTASGGVAPYMFMWSNGSVTQNLNSIPAGDYTVTVTGANGCTKSVEITLPNNDPPFNVTAVTALNTTCNGGNGNINVSVAPNGAYTYEWSNGAMTQDLSNLTGGDYTITVSAGGSCIQTNTFTVTDQPNIPNLNPNPTNASCDLPNGSIALSVTGGVPNFTYNWSNGANTQNLTALIPGTYDVTVTGTNGCTNTASTTVDNVNPVITINGTTNPNTICVGNHNGSITLNVSPPAAYTYTWSNTATTANINGLAPGDYTVTVSKGGSCTETATFTVDDNPNSPAIAPTTTESTCDLANGSIHLTISGSTTPYTYHWSNNAVTKDILNIAAGTYTVTVTGANGCTNTQEVVLDNNNPPFNINGNVLLNTACTSGNGSIDVTVTPNAAYTYHWSTGQTTQDLSNLTAGTYVITVSAGGTCTDEMSFDVTNNPNNPDLSFTQVDANCGLSNGSVNLTVTGGGTPYSYHWSSGQNTQDLANIPAGPFDVTVTGANGCTSTDGVIVNNNDIPITVDGNVTAKTSCIANNGSIVLNLSPANMTINWSTGSHAQTLNGLGIGTYTVTVSAGGTCTQSATFTIDDGTEIPDLTTTVVEAACSLPNGSIDLEPTGGLLPYTYKWSNGKTTQDINNLPPGNYTVTVTTSVGCTATTVANVPIGNIVIEVSGTITDNISCQNPNGTISVGVMPVGYVYTYKWSNGPTTQNITNLSANTYTVTVTLGSCTATASFDVLNSPVLPNLSGIGSPATCGLTNGSVSVNINTGTAPFTYKWSTGALTQNVTSLAPGNYTVTVKDNFGCTSSTTVNVGNNNLVLQATAALTSNTSCTTPNGAIDVTVTPAGMYNYAWSNAAATEDQTGLSVGNYTVTVTFGTSCSTTATFAVVNNTVNPGITAAVTAAICSNPNGAIDLTVANAPLPYVYAWSNGAATEDLSGILAGTYTVTITAANGCQSDTTLAVANNSDSFTLSGSASPLSSCVAPNGSIDLTVTPAGTYVIAWSTGASTEDISGLTPGTYTVSVSTTGSCIASTSFIVDDARTYPSGTQAVTPEICTLGNGAIDLTATGGTTPYVFDWSGGQKTEDLTAISAGTYTVTITGANGCTASASTTVPNNSVSFSISGNATPNSSCVTNNGGVDVTLAPASPGSGLTYTYKWSTSVTAQDLSNLAPGSYTVTVSAGGTCTGTADYTISNIATPPTVADNLTPSFCGQKSGAVNLTVSAGTAPYTYHWSNNTSAQDLTGVASGTYSVTVTGANGCTDAETYAIVDSTVTPTISAISAANSSCVSNNGSIGLTVTPTLTYTYAWSSGQSTATINNLGAGTYTVSVYGGGACTNTASYIITNNIPPPSIAAVPSKSFCGGANGAINLTPSLGVAPYTFKWSNSANSEDIGSIPAGTYGVTVTGANGCTTTGSYIVTDSTVTPILSAVTAPNTSCIVNNGSVTLSVTPANLTYAFKWSNGQAVQNLAGVSGGNYTVTVTTGVSGCTASATYVVASGAGVVSLTGNVTNILCFGNHTGAIDLTPSGGVPGYVYNWSPAAGNIQDLSNLAPGNFAVTVTDAMGCSATGNYVVSQPASAVQISCGQTAVVSEPGLTDGSGKVTISGGVAPYKVVWSPGAGNQSNVPAGNFPITNLAVGTYAVTVTDANGCTTTCSFDVKLLVCTTAIGTMSPTPLSHCGPGCITATYNSAGQFLEPGDVFQYILHTGNSNQIVGEIARSKQPTFCFNPATMTYNTTYYISAAAGNDDGNGNVKLSHFCTVVSIGTPIVFKPKPVASIAQPIKVSCAHPSITLTGSSDLAGATFAWTTIGGNIQGNANQAAISVNAGGNYNLVINLNGCLDTAATPVTDLTNHPKATVKASPQDILDCKISQILLAGTVEGTTNPSLQWMVNGAVFSNGATVPILQPGTYTFIVQDTVSFCKDTAVIKIDQNLAYPLLNMATPGKLTCTHSTVTLTGGSPLPGIQFKWKYVNGTDTTTVGTGTSITVTQPGIYLLVGIDPVNGCTNAISGTVSSDQVHPVANAGTPFSMDCFGQKRNLDGTGSTGAPVLNYLWSTSDGLVISGFTTASPVIGEPGVYNLLVTNPGNGCTDTASVIITPVEPVAVVTVKNPKCHGDKGSIRIDSVIGAKPPIQFSFDGGQHFSTQTYFGNLSAGTYNIFFQDASNCTTKKTVTITEPPPFVITLDPSVWIKSGNTYQIDATVNVPASDLWVVRWTPADWLSCDSCLSTICTPLHTAEYQLYVKTKEGCQATAPFLMQVDMDVDVYVPNIFSPNGDGNNDIFTVFGDPTRVRLVKSLQVYSRWGEQVFANYNFPANTLSAGWNGRLGSQVMDPAVFVWIAVVVYTDGREVLYKGDVTLER